MTNPRMLLSKLSAVKGFGVVVETPADVMAISLISFVLLALAHAQSEVARIAVMSSLDERNFDIDFPC